MAWPRITKPLLLLCQCYFLFCSRKAAADDWSDLKPKWGDFSSQYKVFVAPRITAEDIINESKITADDKKGQEWKNYTDIAGSEMEICWAKHGDSGSPEVWFPNQKNCFTLETPVTSRLCGKFEEYTDVAKHLKSVTVTLLRGEGTCEDIGSDFVALSTDPDTHFLRKVAEEGKHYYFREYQAVALMPLFADCDKCGPCTFRMQSLGHIFHDDAVARLSKLNIDIPADVTSMGYFKTNTAEEAFRKSLPFHKGEDAVLYKDIFQHFVVSGSSLFIYNGMVQHVQDKENVTVNICPPQVDYEEIQSLTGEVELKKPDGYDREYYAGYLPVNGAKFKARFGDEANFPDQYNRKYYGPWTADSFYYVEESLGNEGNYKAFKVTADSGAASVQHEVISKAAVDASNKALVDQAANYIKGLLQSLGVRPNEPTITADDYSTLAKSALHLWFYNKKMRGETNTYVQNLDAQLNPGLFSNENDGEDFDGVVYHYILFSVIGEKFTDSNAGLKQTIVDKLAETGAYYTSATTNLATTTWETVTYKT
eukprot:GHVU01084392.1.p1 GENE.GHVU01084392.1~~GHVU01084392.1.p1  ORF type:complete len:538 (-),score=59.24 GHVU01084392.1:4563-6176(-)